MYILADRCSLKIAYLLLKSVWKICSFALPTVFKILNGEKKKNPGKKLSPLLQALVCPLML